MACVASPEVKQRRGPKTGPFVVLLLTLMCSLSGSNGLASGKGGPSRLRSRGGARNR